MREIVLDTETTGLSPREGHRVVEIGCVELENHLPTGNVYHQYINPQRSMPTGAFEIHGLSEEFLSDKPIFADISQAFLDFIGDAKLIIHNAPFDIGFLNHEFSAINTRPLLMDRVHDTLVMAQKKHTGSQNSLDALCRRYNVDNSGRTKHGALLDAELLAEVYLELIGGAQPHLTLVEKQKVAGPQIQRNTEIKARPKKLENRLSDTEQASHQAFIEELGPDAIWHQFTQKNN